MTQAYDIFLAGGLVMWPLLGLFIVTSVCILERSWFWFRLIIQEKQVVREVLTTAKVDLKEAEEIAESSQTLAIGRFLVEPLRLKKPSPETFHLAIKAACDKEFVEMRKGDIVLKSVAAIAPLLGILGTAEGLINTFTNLKTNSFNLTDFSKVTPGLAQALISSTTAIAITVFAFLFIRIFLYLRVRQIDLFSQIGNDLELIYLQFWHEPSTQTDTQTNSEQ
ncbi:MotA/TolQ/ExbB proton channel family protein [Brasilonema octagenarum UFV-E1]|uniref:MotA/TolQ/ExbB proton channel family protein n=2 Tax=Brasilonema TaxID=383614 RepID=A0A856MK14_9CYAN|nr:MULTISPECIES: MotA/TolQ/ExbB proton channel family protein [Brasilonema]NMF67315.1 MotA/TolQ/ExbB proton channel family protein [Brasilonema octagenarum UFV-OR1]QDL09286.1 MotA/TolQ/ExbB proton channel family protein [Brasilonema sennae CENA114]QDL15643.1 MotA/TolQ/ExbB proton channel family protein [Brasilonema octagenarum UFV-E1]